jgi:hypothetical protein
MTLVPTEWQDALGYPALTGLCCISVASRTSFGPSIWGFNPDDLGVKNPAPTTPFVFYPQDHQTLGQWDAQGIVNLVYNMVTDANAAMAFPAGTASVLIFGTQGTGKTCYGYNTDDPTHNLVEHGPQRECYDPAHEWVGPHSTTDASGVSTYKRWVWAYDVNELLAVKAGRKKPWEVVPYGYWELLSPFRTGDHIQGVGYDSAAQLLYVSLREEEKEAQPIIAVYSINALGGTTPTTGTTTTSPIPTRRPR